MQQTDASINCFIFLFLKRKSINSSPVLHVHIHSSHKARAQRRSTLAEATGHVIQLKITDPPWLESHGRWRGSCCFTFEAAAAVKALVTLFFFPASGTLRLILIRHISSSCTRKRSRVCRGIRTLVSLLSVCLLIGSL
uniref:Uncharacterized protein n=1 Tax=Setaria italica TaxID=4555 RepID=K4AGG4_SETIT